MIKKCFCFFCCENGEKKEQEQAQSDAPMDTIASINPCDGWGYLNQKYCLQYFKDL